MKNFIKLFFIIHLIYFANSCALENETQYSFEVNVNDCKSFKDLLEKNGCKIIETFNFKSLPDKEVIVAELKISLDELNELLEKNHITCKKRPLAYAEACE